MSESRAPFGAEQPAHTFPPDTPRVEKPASAYKPPLTGPGGDPDGSVGKVDRSWDQPVPPVSKSRIIDQA